MEKIFISENLRTLRKSKHLSLKDVQNALGIHEKTISLYESGLKMPALQNLLKISKLFHVSLDFLITWDKTPYLRSEELFLLASKIDKMEASKKLQTIANIETLLGNQGDVTPNIKMDNSSLILSSNIHQNLKEIRGRKGVSQVQVGNDLNIKQDRVSVYENNQTPKAEMLILFSEYYGYSIHAIVTGEKLFFNFDNKDLLNAIIKADRLLTLEDKETVIKLMQRTIQNAGNKNYLKDN